MKKVLIVAPSDLPIPAVKGGAVETGIDQLLDENENGEKIHIDVVAFFDNEAHKKSKKYKKTNFWFYKKKILDDIIFYCLKVYNKLLLMFNIKVNINYRPLFTRFICKKIKLKKYDAILIKNAVSYVIPLSKYADGSLYLQLHNDFLNDSICNASKIVKKCKAIIVNSEYIKKRVLTISAVKERDVFVNMNCLDEKSFEIASKEMKRKILSEHHIGNNKKIILFSGRLVENKGVKELLRAVKKIGRKDDWRLFIAGAKWFGSNKKSRYIKELERISSDISDNIVFLGYVSHSEISYYNSVADVVVVPSIWEEPAGRVALEAAAVGTPVIVSDSGGLKEYIDSHHSIMIKKDEEFIENLAKSISDVIFGGRFNSKKDARDLVSFAKRFNSKRYYYEIMKYMKVLDD